MGEGRLTLYWLIPGCCGVSREQSREHRAPVRSGRRRLDPAPAHWPSDRFAAGAVRIATAVMGPAWFAAGRSHTDTRVGCIV